MVFERIEELKHDYTDKYVVVDETRPELLRFKGAVGQVKTVNMSGRALVEFNTFANIGWYDIDPDFLKVVEAPPPPPIEEKKPEKKPVKEAAAKPAAPTGEKKLSPLEMARMQGAAGAKSAAAAPVAKTTAEILAAARTKKGEAPAAAPPAAKPAAPASAPAAGAKVDRSKLSVAEILAMARGGAAAPSSAPAAAAPVAEEAAEEEVAEVAPPAAPVVAAKPAAPAGNRPKAGELSVEQIMAWCREHDAK